MTIKRILVLILVMSAMIINCAFAGESIEAVLRGNKLEISWTAQGECVLTVYRNSWPISVVHVDGAAGGHTMNVPEEGQYKLRLKTPSGCFTAEADREADYTPEPTPVVDAKPTKVPDAKPTIFPTVKPEVIPTAVPTTKPTATPSAAPTSAVSGSGGQSMTSMAAEVIRQVNEERAKHGLHPLTVSSQLTGAACIRANEIVERFSHTRPDGSSWSTVSNAAAGENIAKGQSTADRVMAAWMSSDGHRANILRSGFGSIGVCVLKVNGVVYWVQLFGR